MDIKLTLRKGRKVIASEVVSNPKQGDLTIVIGRLLAHARRRLDEPVWDCQIDIRQVTTRK